MELKNKTIIIISQEDWGKMFISKHHYAVELAKRGNKVFFLNSPHKKGVLSRGEVKISETEYQGLHVIDHRFGFPSILKFKARPLFDLLIKRHISHILKVISEKVDVVWSFDLSNTLPLKSFKDVDKRIFMAADHPYKDTIAGAETADLILSTNFSDEFLKKHFRMYPVLKKFVSHGVTKNFFQKHFSDAINNPIQVGLSGNFLRPDIDWGTLLSIIDTHPHVQFNFWGATDIKNSNVGYAEGGHLQKLESAKAKNNTTFHGVVNSSELSGSLKKMDVFLICYDLSKDNSKGTNYHKVLEYIATGKVIVANNISSYTGTTDILEMSEEKSNKSLPDIFNKVISDLSYYNSINMQKKRVEFAKGFTYTKNVSKIEELLSST